MNIVIAPERPDSADAQALIGELNAEMFPQYPVESRHGYSVERLLAESVAFFVVRVDGVPAACGGVKLVAREFAELKRMFVRPAYRGRGLARRLVGHLCAHALGHGITVIRLETGIFQHAAIALYEGLGFTRIPPFPPYREGPVSRCYEKRIG